MSSLSAPAPPLRRLGAARRGTAEVLSEAAGLIAGLEPVMAVPALLALISATCGADRAWLDPAPGADQERTASFPVTASLPLTRSASTVGVLALSGGQPERLPRGLIDLLAVAVAPDRTGAAVLAAECDELLVRTADALHDGPSQDAVAARMAAALLERSTGASGVVSEAVAELARSLRMVTAAARPRGADGNLGRTLSMVVDCTPEQGPIVEPGLARLASLVASAAADAVAADAVAADAAAADAVAADRAARSGSTAARVEPGRRGGWTVVLTGAAGALAPVRTQHGARAAALGAQLTATADDLLLHLPAGPHRRVARDARTPSNAPHPSNARTPSNARARAAHRKDQS